MLHIIQVIRNVDDTQVVNLVKSHWQMFALDNLFDVGHIQICLFKHSDIQGVAVKRRHVTVNKS